MKMWKALLPQNLRLLKVKEHTISGDEFVTAMGMSQYKKGKLKEEWNAYVTL